VTIASSQSSRSMWIWSLAWVWAATERTAQLASCGGRFVHRRQRSAKRGHAAELVSVHVHRFSMATASTAATWWRHCARRASLSALSLPKPLPTPIGCKERGMTWDCPTISCLPPYYLRPLPKMPRRRATLAHSRMTEGGCRAGLAAQHDRRGYSPAGWARHDQQMRYRSRDCSL
jgi:hypothetical protein